MISEPVDVWNWSENRNTPDRLMVSLRQFKFENVNRKAAIFYYPKMGLNLGESNNRRGGVQAVRYQTHLVPIHNVSFFVDTLNINQLIDEYLNARKDAGITCASFFPDVRSGKKVDGHEFWRNQPLGHSTCMIVAK